MEERSYGGGKKRTEIQMSGLPFDCATFLKRAPAASQQNKPEQRQICKQTDTI